MRATLAFSNANKAIPLELVAKKIKSEIKNMKKKGAKYLSEEEALAKYRQK